MLSRKAYGLKMLFICDHLNHIYVLDVLADFTLFIEASKVRIHETKM